MAGVCFFADLASNWHFTLLSKYGHLLLQNTHVHLSDQNVNTVVNWCHRDVTVAVLLIIV